MAERARTALLAALVAGAGLLGFRQGERAVESPAAAVGAAVPVAAPEPGPTAELPPIDTLSPAELAQSLPRVREAAERGRADAAYALFRLSKGCVDSAAQPAPDEDAARRDDCAKLGNPDAARHFGWLAQAVRGGNVPAIRAALYGPAPPGPPGTGWNATVVRHAEALADVHRAVREAVGRAISGGDRDVLFHYALALRGDGLLRADPDAAYAHMVAASLAPHAAYGATTATGHLEDLARHWDAARVDAARREGERIAHAHFGWQPGG